jgi:hypothetical protein
MGTSYYVYVGAYLECTSKEVTLTRKAKQCPNKHVVNQWNVQEFCAQCGQKIVEGEEQYQGRNVSSHDVYEKFGDILYAASMNGGMVDYYKPNIRGEYGLRISIRQDELFGKELPLETIAAQIANFKTQFAEQIAAITKLYGNGEVKWGVLYEAN